MPCYKPLQAWLGSVNPETGKRYVLFSNPNKVGKASVSEFVELPCGKCVGCRLERSRQWAIRCVHEAQLHEENCFITLTFSDEYLDPKGSLVRADFQKFMKRLRKKFKGKKIRYMHAGEYGEKTGRPHHHAILFGIDFQDKKYHNTRNGHRVYTSQTLEEVWGKGLSEIGDVTFESAAYVARYCCKKQNEKQDFLTKEKELKDGRIKEYNTMSRKPGLASDWLKKYGNTDVWNDDTIVIRGMKMKPPKFYSKNYELTNPKEFSIIKAQRKRKAVDNKDNRWERLPAREKCQQARFKQLVRSL